LIDRAMKIFGAAGIGPDTTLAAQWANSRTLLLADGPDEVHRNTVDKLELKKHAKKHKELVK
uniref:acyl-CoA dehydrogenase family protein n=1 Tax=Lysinibacillus sp. D4A3_S15 TaxID=2941227 RepID=UPI0024BEE1DC